MNCECDEELAHTLTNLAVDGQFDEQFLTNDDGSGFDHVGQCHAVTNTGGNSDDNGSDDPTNPNGNGGNGGGNNIVDDSTIPPVQCCGTYPNRFDFLTHKGNRACCGGKTYNVNKHDCCDGFISQIGSCAARRK